MHAGAPAHFFTRAGQDVLNNTFHDWWIGRGGPTAWHRIVDACQTIRIYPSNFERMQQSTWDVSRHALNLMMDSLSIYYKCALSAITHRLNVSGHMLIWTFFSCFDMWNSYPKFVCTFQLHPVYFYRILFDSKVLSWGSMIWKNKSTVFSSRRLYKFWYFT
jgi:hypothetical protein